MRATFVIDGEEITFSDAFSGIDRSVEPSLTGYSLSFTAESALRPALYFTTDQNDLTLWEQIHHATFAAIAAPQPEPAAVVSPAFYAAMREMLRAGVQPYDGGDDRVDALMHAHSYIYGAPRRRSVFARATALRAELVDLLTTPDGFPFVAHE